jgi:hypothetical protein
MRISEFVLGYGLEAHNQIPTIPTTKRKEGGAYTPLGQRGPTAAQPGVVYGPTKFIFFSFCLFSVPFSKSEHY